MISLLFEWEEAACYPPIPHGFAFFATTPTCVERHGERQSHPTRNPKRRCTREPQTTRIRHLSLRESASLAVPRRRIRDEGCSRAYGQAEVANASTFLRFELVMPEDNQSSHSVEAGGHQP